MILSVKKLNKLFADERIKKKYSVNKQFSSCAIIRPSLMNLSTPDILERICTVLDSEAKEVKDTHGMGGTQ